MIGSKSKPKDVKSFMYRRILFDKSSEVYYITEAQLEDYRLNHIERIIKDYQDGKNTLRHQLELSELIAISYDCYFGIAPTSRELSLTSKFPYIFKKYHQVYEEAWLSWIFTLLNSYKIGAGDWRSYSKYAKMNAIRSVKRHCKKEAKEEKMLEEYKTHLDLSHHLDHDKFYSSYIESAKY